MNDIQMSKTQLAQSALQSYLRLHSSGKTSEIAKAVNMSSALIRKAGLSLAARSIVGVELVAGKGSGEYKFSQLQRDLFDGQPEETKTLWQKIKSFFK